MYNNYRSGLKRPAAVPVPPRLEITGTKKGLSSASVLLLATYHDNLNGELVDFGLRYFRHLLFV